MKNEKTTRPRFGAEKGLAAAVFFGLFLLAACAKRETLERDLDGGAAYFPLRVGQFLEYEADSIIFDYDGSGGLQRDTNHFFIREILADTFRDAAGELAFRLERFERKNEAEAWALKSVFWTQLLDNQAFRIENNQRFLKLQMPLDRRSEWDGNRFLNKTQGIAIAGDTLEMFKGWLYEVDSIDVRRTVGAFVFDSSMVVTEADYDDKIDRRFSRSVYARGVGEVFREQLMAYSRCADDGDLGPCAGKNWQEIASKGFFLRQVLVKHN